MSCGESVFNLRSKDACEGHVCVCVFKYSIKNKSSGFFSFDLLKLQRYVSVGFLNTVMCESFVLFCSALFLACFSLHLSFTLDPMKYESQISNVQHVGTGFTASLFFPFVCLGTHRFENYLPLLAH